jgi:GNAT superfamily N-acetyltransferase
MRKIMTKSYKIAVARLRVERFGLEFKAFLGRDHIGQAFVSNPRPGEYVLDAIDIFDHSEDGGPNYQRQGYGSQLMQQIATYLKSVGATKLRSANEGSGTVQMLDRTFGRNNVQHFHGGVEVDFEQAKQIMDVDYGRTLSTVNLDGQKSENH